ncbi:hypothetical protein NEOLEDRAFT_1154512 [Neolentinus lepideus HHB14362 ss-1]|uniref:DAGKc domain-containing protein n=1 Tax=Neolentinus lepideus HHB14362 ss-1 TaxID=1314782 RepID=A0A165USH2_9AGAM|nr:hypothetical protein NEOLEDRAFT_1154512 [Neolentinus lepideus HHB14362 ss-1]
MSIALYNPVSGDGSATQFFSDHVLPLLDKHNKSPALFAPTEHPGHAAELVASFLSAHPDSERVTVIVGSGDGTVHEIVNGVASLSSGKRDIELVLVPLGTANALYASLFPPSSSPQDPTSYRLLALHSFLASSSPRLLALAETSLASTTIYSAVVTSTALHASILHDSEALRKDMPGIERFKVAAHQNITRWYNASVVLRPPKPDGSVQVYDPATKSLIPYGKDAKLQGPFAYFLSTVNVDRLEPLFRITPLFSSIPPPPSTPSLDIAILRPLRDPAVSSAAQDDREIFAQKAGRVLGEAYNNGAHVNLRYAEDRQPVTDGDGEAVVEYFRCGGFEWIPDESDDRAHLLCADGAIFNIPPSGRTTCSAVASTRNGVRFSVYSQHLT